jgi:AMMECR1 domain-containing protein
MKLHKTTLTGRFVPAIISSFHWYLWLQPPKLFYCVLQVGKHGLIIEFTDPDYNVRRSATYLPEVAAHEGEFFSY